MSEKSKKLIYLIYGILQSMLLLICGSCLIAACLDIYDGGGGTFSREAVTAQFDRILLPVILCLGGVIVGCVLTLILPREPKKVKGGMMPSDAIRRMSVRVDWENCPTDLIAAQKKERVFRLVLRIMAGAVCVAVAIPSVLYLLNLSHFDDIGNGLTEDIVDAMRLVLPAAAVGLSAWIVVTLACHFSEKRELAVVKDALKAAPVKEKVSLGTKESRPYGVWIVRGSVLLVAVVLIVLGIVNGGMEDVLQKAIRICTECIGLG